MDSRDEHLLALLSARSYSAPDFIHSTMREPPTQQRSNTSIFNPTKTRKNVAGANTLPTTDIGQTTEVEVEVLTTPQLRPVRKRGRPPIEAPDVAVLSSDRRKQIRQAQKTYQLKKQATLDSYKARVAELEGKLQRMAELVSESHESDKSKDLARINPVIARNLRGMHELLGPEIDGMRKASIERCYAISYDDPVRSTSIFGKTNDNHIISPALISGLGDQALEQSTAERINEAPTLENARKWSLPNYLGNEVCDRLPIPLPGLRSTERTLSGNIPITYSSQETDFSRRVQRFCLEHAYRLFTNTRSDPVLAYRVFRLAPCIQDKMKMAPYFQKLVSAGIKDRLEIPTLPFYCIGGAGTHYPREDSAGLPTSPSNMRMPRRLLGILPTERTLAEDPQSRLLKLLGFDGEWFDCHDVQGYLEEKGVVLNQSSVFAEIRTPWHQQTTSLNRSQFVLNLEVFLAMLLKGLAILGRAPGFKRLEVEAAFNYAVQVQV